MGTSKSTRPILPNKFHTILALTFALIAWQMFSLLFIPRSDTQASDLTVNNIIESINKERSLRNLNTLSPDTRLASAATYKANDMMSRHYFSHTDPEGNYIWNKIIEAGYTPYLQLGENLAIEFNNTESLVSAWMNSPTHKANILNEGFNDQGMGLSFGAVSAGQYYSSIANTFGALAFIKKPAAPPAQKDSVSTTTPKIPVFQPEPAPTQVSPTPTSANPETQNKIPGEPLRSSPKSNSTEKISQNFILPGEATLPTTATDTVITQTAQAVMPTPYPQEGLNAYEINRYLMLSLAMVLITMAISDLKKILKEKFRPYDKITNNLVLLVLSLIVISFMYWL